MGPNVRTALGAGLAVGLTVAVAAAPAAARMSGKEAFLGRIIAPSESGTRTVASSLAVAGGVFDGVGKIVEIPNRPGDPDNVSRDNLVFKAGTMHIRSVNKGEPKISLDPQTCAVKVRIKQTTKVLGGTRMFRRASGTFASTVRSWGVAARNPDGTCNVQTDLLLDADSITARGTISY
jgi:hypothetical protein